MEMEGGHGGLGLAAETEGGCGGHLLSPLFGDGAPGWSSRLSQETPAPVSDWCVRNCLFSSHRKWMLKGFVVH